METQDSPWSCPKWGRSPTRWQGHLGFPIPQTDQQLDFHPLQHSGPQASSGLSFTVILCFTHVPPTPARLGPPRAGTVSVLCEYRAGSWAAGPHGRFSTLDTRSRSDPTAHQSALTCPEWLPLLDK